MALAVTALRWLVSESQRQAVDLGVEMRQVLYVAAGAIVTCLAVSSLLHVPEPEIGQLFLLEMKDFAFAGPERNIPNTERNSDQPAEFIHSKVVSITDGTWQTVSGTSGQYSVFAAYYEDRRGFRQIRVIAVAPTRSRGPALECRFQYGGVSEQNGGAHRVPARVRAIREEQNLRFSASFVLCPLQPGHPVPRAVAVVLAGQDDPGGNLLRVQRSNGKPHPSFMAVCVPPLQRRYNKVIELVEFLELYTILGVHQFTFYDRSIGPQVSCVLQDYMSRGLVKLLPWRLDVVSEAEIYSDGVLAALNDCLYRQMSRHALLAFVDVNEYLVPQEHESTLPEFIEWLGTQMDTSKAGAFSFPNASFAARQVDEEELVQPSGAARHLVTASRTLRSNDTHNQRSQYICRTKYTVEVGTRFVLEMLPGYRSVHLSRTQASSHQYREDSAVVEEPHVRDRTAHRFLDELLTRVARVWDRLGERCGLPHLPGLLEHVAEND